MDDKEDITVTVDTTDSLNLPYADYKIDMSSMYNYSTVSGTSGSFLTSTGANGTSWSSSPYVYTTNNTNAGSISGAGLHVTSDAEFEGDIKWKGRSLGKLLQSIEDRLAILQEPSPEKLEKYAALKKAYDHYKTLERLIGDD